MTLCSPKNQTDSKARVSGVVEKEKRQEGKRERERERERDGSQKGEATNTQIWNKS